jgi:ABC-type glutathione transport system ATPase component
VIGETGSGKSTLAAAVSGRTGTGEHGVATIVGGSLRVLGENLRGMNSRARDHIAFRVGYVPQNGGALLAPGLTVGDNVALPIYSRSRHHDRSEAGVAVAIALDAVRLPLRVTNSFPHELSQGQRQRVAIAQALVLQPELLVADDPASGIDLAAREPILDMIRDLQHQRSFSALVVSHTISEVRRLSDRVLVMHRGMVAAVGNVDDVLREPEHAYVAGLSRALRDLKRADELTS